MSSQTSALPQGNLKPQRNQTLDLARAFAAIAVLTYHVWQYRLPNPNRPTREGDWAQILFELRLGLILFLVLSGYLLYKPFVEAAKSGKRIQTRRFLARRFSRIVPAYYAALVGTFALLWGIGDAAGVRLPPAEQLPLFLIFGQNYSPQTLLQFDPPTWTLAVQAAFYLALPFLAMLRRRDAGGWPLVGALVALGLLWNFAVLQLDGGPITRLALPALIGYFALGMAIALVPQSLGRRVWPLALGTILLGFVLVGFDAWWHNRYPGGNVPTIMRDLPAAAGFALIVLALVWLGQRRSCWLTPLESVGRWSYGLFLWHVPVILFLRAHGALFEQALLAWLQVFAAATVLGWASWHWLESRPGRATLR